MLRGFREGRLYEQILRVTLPGGASEHPALGSEQRGVERVELP